jgi:hypothetical protein
MRYERNVVFVSFGDVFLFYLLLQVMYENGEWEELSIEDTLLIHCKDIKNIPPNSANMCFKYCLRNYRHLNPTLTWNGRFIRQISLPLFDEIDRTDVECTLQFNLSLCNRFVKKNFGEGTFFGYVVSYNNPYYQVLCTSIALVLS